MNNQNSETQGKKILVVEDNIVNQKVIRIILDKNGYEYDMANDGNEAVEKYNLGSYKMILMDCQMPIMDGLQASMRIRSIESDKKSARCPIIAMTANAMKGDKEKCLTAGMDDFLSKPFKSNELLLLVEQWNKK